MEEVREGSSASRPDRLLRESYDATLSKDAALLAETVMMLHEVRREGEGGGGGGGGREGEEDLKVSVRLIVSRKRRTGR